MSMNERDFTEILLSCLLVIEFCFDVMLCFKF